MPGPRVTLSTGRSRRTTVFSRYSSVVAPMRDTTVGASSATIVRSLGAAGADRAGGAVRSLRAQNAHSESRSGSARRQVGQRGRDL